LTISSYLEQDHRRIEDILQRATSAGAPIKLDLYGEFRGALLRHIGIEEKILFPAIRNATGGSSLPGIEQLHLDHGALAALLVPTPTQPILSAIHTILRGHNTIEEGPEGIYAQFEKLPGIEAGNILARLQAAPPVPLNPHVDNAIALESMRAAVHRAGYPLNL
jgi:hemerythrin HHE cation binding domain-containing protein